MSDRTKYILLLAASVALVAFGGRGLPKFGWGGEPSPFAAEGLHVLVVEETTERGSLPRPQLMQLDATAEGSLRAWCKDHGAQLVVEDEGNVAPGPDWQPAWDGRPRDAAALPWIAAGDGRHGFAGALPATAAETIAKLKPLGAK